MAPALQVLSVAGLALAAAAAATVVAYPVHQHQHQHQHHTLEYVAQEAQHHNDLDEAYYTHPQYKFDYAVHDPHTGDVKHQWETRDGDAVKGEYSLVEPDGTIRTVEYTADKHTGFNAVVKHTGHAQHPHVVDHGHGHGHGQESY